MAADLEYRCFIGGLSWSTSDRDLEEAFRSFGNILEAKVVVDRDTGRSKGFGFVTFDDERAMEAAIDRMHGIDLDGRSITVDKAQTKSGGGGGGGRGYGGSGGGGGRGYGGGGGQDCFKCGQPGHWARECPNSGGGGGGRQLGDRYGGPRGDRDGRGDWYGNGGGGGRNNNGRNGDRYGGRSGSYRESGGHGGGERYGGGRGGGERYSGGPARNDSGNYRDRTGPYDRPSGVGSRSYEDRH